jgi:hypothetical protein
VPGTLLWVIWGGRSGCGRHRRTESEVHDVDHCCVMEIVNYKNLVWNNGALVYPESEQLASIDQLRPGDIISVKGVDYFSPLYRHHAVVIRVRPG